MHLHASAVVGVKVILHALVVEKWMWNPIKVMGDTILCVSASFGADVSDAEPVVIFLLAISTFQLRSFAIESFTDTSCNLKGVDTIFTATQIQLAIQRT